MKTLGSGVKLKYSTEERETTFGSSELSSRGSKKRGFKRSGFTVKSVSGSTRAEKAVTFSKVTQWSDGLSKMSRSWSLGNVIQEDFARRGR